MKYQIIGKNIEVTDSIRADIEKKLARMDKYFVIDDNVLCRAVVRSYTVGAKVEITIFTKEMDFRAEVKNADLYAAVDLAVDKLEGQMRKLKTRIERKKETDSLGRALALENIRDYEKEDPDEVVRTKSIRLEPMTIDEAITRMEALGHSFFMYLDEEDDEISVVYARVDGGYGVIEAENRLA
ncbi:MAG: ribosome-associated translation inhibitor RaiA [Mollicutes bacterium]|nr:ribosome-associated translation inhibitor RaiA [bacterium]MDD6801366.1 ribosome-associated translation inhibitor RaiA [Mollicutes bacterium]MDD7064319.1 ribosome-associated translation inhibitor RaiA [Mollicutes bacterium]MDY2687398.1 ribosome-associated translation inhibitor RaiA [Candidatus Enteromonas sp.]MDY5298144.1 ribosome-associated translation inhibitor RaiA [Candidatus Enteromonas sp.]